MAKKTTPDWIAEVQADLPDPAVTLPCRSYATAAELIKVAAFNRRMKVEDFVARAALAVAVADSKGTDPWEVVSEKEPPLSDLRRHRLPPRRLRGRGFGAWRITGMEE